MVLNDLYPSFLSSAMALTSIYDLAWNETCSKTGLSSLQLNLLLAAFTFEPEPVSAALLNIRSPYTSPDLYESNLKKLGDAGFLEPAAAGGYRLSALGLETVKGALTAIYASLAGVMPLGVTKIMDLASRLNELADACLAAPDPPGTWSIQHVHRLDPGRGAPVMVRIDQFLSELCAFRDDAHLVSWHAYETNGHAWDILSYLWQNKSGTAEQINLALNRRGNALADTIKAADHLVHKGWVMPKNDTLLITPFGIEVRQTAEETTDRYYFIPFRNFPDEYLTQTISLLNDFKSGIPS